MRQPCGALPSLFRLMLFTWPALAAGEPFVQTPTAPLAESDYLASTVSIGVRIVANARRTRGAETERFGTGVLVEPGGYVLTSAFLIEEAESIVLTTADARTVRAAVAAEDATSGIAILRPAAGLGVRPLPLGSSAALGIPAAATIAAAASGRRLVTATVVARREFAGHWEYLVEEALFTTPAIAEWAGAALIDGGGRLIGIGSLLLANVAPGAATTLPGNLFIPVERFQPALTRIARGDDAKGERRPWLGLVLERTDGPLVIAEVPPGSPAHRAGLRAGDVVMAVNGDPVVSYATLYRRIWRERPGADLVLTLRREGAPHEVRLRAIDPQDYLIHRVSR